MGWVALIPLGLKMLTDMRAASDAEESGFKQSEMEIQELQRQSVERDRMAEEERSDRVREADQRFASIYAAMNETGASAQMGAFAAENNIMEAVDLSRIESNRSSDQMSLQAQARGVAVGFKDLKNRAAAARTGSLLNFGFAATSVGIDESRQERERGQATQTEAVGTRT